MAANVLGVTLASALVTGAVAETAAPIAVFAAQQEAQTQEKIIYLNGSIQAGENADGTGQAQAVDSFEKAFAWQEDRERLWYAVWSMSAQKRSFIFLRELR